jgi:ABC-2 type transport system permease protein
MKRSIAFWSIMRKDFQAYYLKPPNISWGLIFPLAWAGMFFIRSGSGLQDVPEFLPGLVAVSILFGTTSMLAVNITFEKKNRSFERLLISPIRLEVLMLAKTLGAIIFGALNSLVPVVIASFLTDLSDVNIPLLIPAVILIAISTTFMGLFVAVSVSEVFEAQTFSNFFRFPMVFLCGLFLPIRDLPSFLQPLSYVLPLTYGADILHGALNGQNQMPLPLDFLILGAFCVVLFTISLRNIKIKWID